MNSLLYFKQARVHLFAHSEMYCYRTFIILSNINLSFAYS